MANSLMIQPCPQQNRQDQMKGLYHHLHILHSLEAISIPYALSTHTLVLVMTRRRKGLKPMGLFQVDFTKGWLIKEGALREKGLIVICRYIKWFIVKEVIQLQNSGLTPAFFTNFFSSWFMKTPLPPPSVAIQYLRVLASN